MRRATPWSATSRPASDPIHKATIIPRGRALGMVMRLPEGDRISVSREKLNADIAVAMGGRVAEELIFGHDKVTAGAASDIEQATKIARAHGHPMGDERQARPDGVRRESAGGVPWPLDHPEPEHLGGHRPYDRREIRRIVDEGYAGAQTVISTISTGCTISRTRCSSTRP